MSRIWDWKETAIVGLESSSMPCTGRSTAKQYVNRSFKRHSKRGGYRERYEEDV